MAFSTTTEFAPAERAAPVDLQRQTQAVDQGLGPDSLLGIAPAMMMILNGQRQIVYANSSVLRLLNLKDMEHLRGLRPGEALHCTRAGASASGCGTTAFCRTCGAVQAILSAQEGRPDTRECRIVAEDGGGMDLRVWTTPVEFNGEKFVVFSVMDIGDEKRRRALERIFFHDILNAAAGLRGLSELISGVKPEDVDRFHGMIHDLAGKLIEDIQAQRDLTNAEHHDLAVKPAEIRSGMLIAEALGMYRTLATAHGVVATSSADSQDLPFTSDKVLLRRVLGNLIKNAIEASQPGDTVTLSCHLEGDRVVFSVHNPAVIPADVQLQLFQRSFSTKGDGRGLGTYSIKLFTEGYLKGKVSFTSAQGQGSVFSVSYPLFLAPSPRESRAGG